MLYERQQGQGWWVQRGRDQVWWGRGYPGQGGRVLTPKVIWTGIWDSGAVRTRPRANTGARASGFAGLCLGSSASGAKKIGQRGCQVLWGQGRVHRGLVEVRRGLVDSYARD